MLSEESKIQLKQLIDENFSDMSEEERKAEFQNMVNQPGAYTIYLVYWQDHLARIGVKCREENGRIRKLYMHTEHDSEILDW